MVTKVHRDALRGEIASLRELIGKSAGRDPLGSRSLSRRLATLEAELEKIEARRSHAANVALIFDGAAVRGSSGIEADFAGKALIDYQELIAKHVAVSEGGLAERGRIPIQVHQQSQMTITGLVHGSFGFILEEDNSEQLGMFETPAHLAVLAITELLKDVAASQDGAFEARLEELDARIFQALKRFVGHLYRAESTLKVAEEDRELRLDRESVERAFQRVSRVEIEEVDETLEGELLGLVPVQRRFDFRRNDTGEVLQGRVAPTLSADYLERIDREGVIAGGLWRASVKTKVLHHPDGRHSTVTYLLTDLIAL